MESTISSEKNIDIDQENQENLEAKEIFTLENNTNHNQIEENELISDEEFLLDCCRFGDLEELKNLFIENPNIDINYCDKNKTNSLRKKNIFKKNRYG